jgi:hypothetical protein
MLQGKGADASGVGSVEEAADLVCQLEQHNELCSESNEFGCSDGLSCDISSQPGICVDSGVASSHIDRLSYQGKQIVGSKRAIRKLRKKLKLKKFKEPDPFSQEGIVRKKILKKAARVSGKEINEFSRMSNEQLLDFIEGFDVKEKTAKNRLIQKLVREYNTEEDDLSELSIPQLQRRAALLRGQKSVDEHDLSATSGTREELIETLAAWMHVHPSKFAGWKLSELQQRLASLKDWEDPQDWLVNKEEYRGRSKRDLIMMVSEITGMHRANYNDWSRKDLIQRLEAAEIEPRAKSRSSSESTSDDSDEEEVVAPVAKSSSSSASTSDDSDEEEVAAPVVAPVAKSSSSDDSDEEEVAAPVVAKSSSSSASTSDDSEDSDDDSDVAERAAQEDVDFDNVERVLVDVMAGKKGQIEDFSRVQNLVLKCLGVIGD